MNFNLQVANVKIEVYDLLFTTFVSCSLYIMCILLIVEKFKHNAIYTTCNALRDS
jgi:hypothetical protein